MNMTCKIVRDIKILNYPNQYCLIFHRIARYCPVVFFYCPILSSIFEYCSLFFNIIHAAISALSCLSCDIDKNILILYNIVKYCQILSVWYCPMLHNIVQYWLILWKIIWYCSILFQLLLFARHWDTILAKIIQYWYFPIMFNIVRGGLKVFSHIARRRSNHTNIPKKSIIQDRP